MLLSEATRDEYVTHLALDLGYNDEQIRKAVIAAGFKPLPPKEKDSDVLARMKEECLEGVASIKHKFTHIFKKISDIQDFDYSNEPEYVMVGFTCNIIKKNKTWPITCWANVYIGETEPTYTCAYLGDDEEGKKYSGFGNSPPKAYNQFLNAFIWSNK